MNKKLLSVLLCVLLALAAIFVVSCGNDSTDTGTSSGDTNDTSTGTNTDTDTDTGTVTPTECNVVFVLGNGEEDVSMTIKYGDVK